MFSIAPPFGAEVTQVYARKHGSMREEERIRRQTRLIPALVPSPARERPRQKRSGGAGRAVASGLLGILLGGVVGVASALVVGVKAKGIARRIA